jgi:hypothetical protein
MRNNTLVAPSLLQTPMPVLSVVVPDLNVAMTPQVLVTLDADGPWRLSVPKGPVDFVVCDNTMGYSVRRATLTDVSSNNGSAVSLAFTAFFEDITSFPNGA